MLRHAIRAVAVVTVFALPAIAQATTVTYDTNTLTTQGTTAVVDGVTMTTSASNGGKVNVYTGTGPNGLNIGSADNPNGQVNGATNPASGDYALTFSSAVTSVSVSFGFLTDNPGLPQYLGREAIFGFVADLTRLLPHDITYVSNDSTFVGGVITPNDAENRASGVITYSGAAFNSFGFSHTQDPRLLGFVITGVTAEIAPVPLPAGLPLLLAGLAAFGVVRRKAKTA